MSRVSTSRGTTRVLLEGSILFPLGRPTPRPPKKPTHDRAETFGVVYVNDLARETMFNAKPAVFPVGSIIVREKLSHLEDKQAELLAIMVKRFSGFNPKVGDWEFFVVDGSLTRVTQRQRTGSCSACHRSQKETDYVFPVGATKQ